MQADEYDAFTRELTDRVARDERVLGLVAVGSMAQQDYRADEWSDHDFLLVTQAGTQETFREELAWLPRHDEIVLSFRETAHGLKVLYGDAHLVEFAVLDLDELALASINRYRVLVDRDGVEATVRGAVERESDRPSDEYHFGQLVTDVQVAIGRTARGEALSGRFFHVLALRHLCALLADDAPLLDTFDPLRRFERVYPELGAEVASAEPVDLLRIAQRELRRGRPDLPWAALEAVLLEQA